MEYYKKIGSLLCGMMLMMQSCVTNNLDDCPDAVRYALAFEYTLHTTENSRDRFYDEVDKMYVYVFDAITKECAYVDTLSLLAPFEDDFVYPLSLNVGKYDIIVWGWGRNPGDQSLKMSTAIVPTIVPGRTSIDDARLQLEESIGGICDGRLEKIFYSERRNVDISAFVSRIDTLPLMNISNEIRIVIPDAIATSAMWKDIEISITGDDGAYLFNSLSRAAIVEDSYSNEGYFKSGNNAPDIAASRGSVTYLPYKTYYTDRILEADPIYLREPYRAVGDSMLIAEISTLRLVQDNRTMEVVVKWNDTNGNSITKKLPLLELLQEAIVYYEGGKIQYNLDRYHRWEITINLTDASMTATVSVMDWHRKPLPGEIGGILQ